MGTDARSPGKVGKTPSPPVRQSKELKHFLELCTMIGADTAMISTEIEREMTNLRERRDNMDPSPIEHRWYESLELEEPDYTIYDGDEYLAEAWVCWTIYSSKYLKWLDRQNIIRDVKPKTIVDVGCGIGYSTLELARTYPEANVTGTQRPNRQARVASAIRNTGDEFHLMCEFQHPADVVFASEYFEHFERPVEHLDEILDIGKPKLLIEASTFGRPSPGHFEAYWINDRWVTGRGVSYAFHKRLRERGYELTAKGWNGRPACWSLVGE